MKQTLVIGAVAKADRYSFKAVHSLVQHDEAVIAFGTRSGEIAGITIETVWNPNWEVDTVTLYINPLIQEAYYQPILALKPRRVIFNPGTENETFIAQLERAGIHAEVACTLVLLSIDQY